VAATLERWGVRSVGDLARLPEAEVASRLGRAGAELHAIARGRDPRPLVPWQPPPTFREGMSLEWPLVNLEPFLFVGRAALDRLTRRLESRGLACGRLELVLRLEPDGVDERSLTLPAPTREVKTLLTLLRLDLEGRPPGAPVTAFTLLAHPDRPREAQLSLFGPTALSPDRLATTLARLFALLGPQRSGSPATVDGHRPERFALTPFAPPPPPEALAEPPPPRRNGRGLLAVRVLRPAVPLEVLVEGHGGPAEGDPAARRPVSLAPAPGAEVARPLILRGRVRVAAGPWGLEEGWWSESPAERDYWDVELAAGGLVRIYRDRASGDWFADGVYD
jgi:protein ImuB